MLVMLVEEQPDLSEEKVASQQAVRPFHNLKEDGSNVLSDSDGGRTDQPWRAGL